MLRGRVADGRARAAADDEDSYTKEETKSTKFVNLVHAASLSRQASGPQPAPAAPAPGAAAGAAAAAPARPAAAPDAGTSGGGAGTPRAPAAAPERAAAPSSPPPPHDDQARRPTRHAHDRALASRCASQAPPGGLCR
jgi:hypothetical protein